MRDTQNTTQGRGDWYAIVSAGSFSTPVPARGPFRGRDEAEAAWERFAERHGGLAGTYLAATSARIVGPFRTRSIAQDVDISDYHRHLGNGGSDR